MQMLSFDWLLCSLSIPRQIASSKTLIFLAYFFNSRTICRRIFLTKWLKINFLSQILLKQLDYSLSISLQQKSRASNLIVNYKKPFSAWQISGYDTKYHDYVPMFCLHDYMTYSSNVSASAIQTIVYLLQLGLLTPGRGLLELWVVVDVMEADRVVVDVMEADQLVVAADVLWVVGDVLGVVAGDHRILEGHPHTLAVEVVDFDILVGVGLDHIAVEQAVDRSQGS